jgi:methylenetetrahydrofolate dehydrogenase (NADP+)/methenyltetrahydrofolate cyclohydrolase
MGCLLWGGNYAYYCRYRRRMAQGILTELRSDVSTLITLTGKTPKLTVLLVGERKDSMMYVRMKERAALHVGIVTNVVTLPFDSGEQRIIDMVRKLSEDKDVHGILVQLPLPAHIDERRVINSICPEKDVDGLTITNKGILSLSGCKAPMIPCTPLGCVELLERSHVRVEGAHVIMIGRSHLVGQPLSQLLLSRNATVTVCHSHTRNIKEITRTGDIIIVAVGRPHFLQHDWVKAGAVVIDVGIHDKDGKVIGDVNTGPVSEVASMVTPVPGGVGPMTVAMLMRNTVIAFRRQNL